MTVTRSFFITFIVAVLLVFQSALALTDTRAPSTKPKEIYGPQGEAIAIRIGNGGAGPTGILRALAEDYIKGRHGNFTIAWYQDISHNTLKQLQRGVIDIALVYEKKEADAAMQAGWATHYTPIFNDHFLIVGPKNNPAKLDKNDTAESAFAKIAGQGKAASRAMFLSRDDHSGTNVKEQTIWQSLGLKPWEDKSSWYYTFHVFPKDALIEADKKALYTITDRGTWLPNAKDLQNTVIYVQGGKTLLNPCFALTGKHPSPAAIGFLHYLHSDRAQQLIAAFGKARYDGQALFTRAMQQDF